MSRLADLVRDFRRHSSEPGKSCSYEVVTPGGDLIVPPRKGAVHYRIHTNVSEPDETWGTDGAENSNRDHFQPMGQSDQ
jgi:hypothetical protein